VCIIVYHPKNAKQITKETLSICFQNNDDGAGYSFWDKEKNKWIIRKGFMEWDDFWESFNGNDFQSENIWSAHFRIGTSGKTDGGNTHPFPVCDDYVTMRKTEYETNIIAVHNGVMGKGEDDFSDTMKHIKEILFPMRDKINDKKFLKIFGKLCNTSSNRWLIASEASTLLLGDWKKFEGSYYSNTSYEEVKTWKAASASARGYNSSWNDPYNWYNKRGENRKGTSKDELDCPSCGEKEFIAPSLFSNFKKRCYCCGAVFDPITDNISFFVPINDIAY